MWIQLLAIAVQAETGRVYADVSESYDTIATLIKLFLLFIVIFIVFRLIVLLVKRSRSIRESDAKLINMQAEMKELAKKKMAEREGNKRDLDEVK